MIDCRCGYVAEDMDDLARHITSWDNYLYETGQDDRILEHAEG